MILILFFIIIIIIIKTMVDRTISQEQVMVEQCALKASFNNVFALK